MNKDIKKLKEMADKLDDVAAHITDQKLKGELGELLAYLHNVESKESKEDECETPKVAGSTESNLPSGAVAPPTPPQLTEAEKLQNKVWKRVQKARQKGRPTTLDYINAIIDDFIECHGDRLYMDDAAIVGGIGRLGETAVTVIGHQKGKDLNDNLARNFGMAHPEGYRKALRLMKQAEKFKRPVICLIDTSGAYCGLGAEERGQGEAIARNLFEMSGLKVPIIAIVIGEGGSGGALALGVGDRIAMLENAIYSVLSPEGFATILWKDSSRAKEAAAVMKITADHLHEFGIIDAVLPETEREGVTDAKATAKTIKRYLEKSLAELSQLNVDDMLKARYEKFRVIGQVIEQ